MTEPIHVRARKFLQEFFNDEELTTLCFDYFPQVYNDFTQEMTKNQKIVRLISFSQRWERLDNLLAALEQERPEQYRIYFVESADKDVEVVHQNTAPEKQIVTFWPTVVSRYKKLDIVEKIFSIIASIIAIITLLLALDNINFPSFQPSTTGKPIGAELGDTWNRHLDDMKMVFVPAGTFLMGSNPANDSLSQDNEVPQRLVKLDSYWIDRTEVTNAQFANFLNAEGNQLEDNVQWLQIDDPETLIEFNGTGFLSKVGFARHPVSNVSWYGAVAYCHWVGGSLPTEAQWEYAAKGNDERMFPWGNEQPTCNLTQFGGCLGNSVEVASLSPAGDSWIGVVDMAGNVWEWVADWYDEDYYENGLTNNPLGPATGTSKVMRGGSWGSSSQFIRVTNRYSKSPRIRDDLTGFRCVFLIDQ